jgi:hypothetical protein
LSDCGHTNPEENRFCGMCGARLRWSNSQTYTPDISGESANPLVPLPGQFSGRTGSQAEAQPGFEGYGEYTDALLADLTPVTTEEAGNEAAQLWEHGPRQEAPVELLDARTATEREPFPNPEPTPSFAIGGPSFLGLGEAPDQKHSYLLEDESTGSGRVWALTTVAFLILLGAVAVALGQNWRGSRDWAVTQSAYFAEKVRNWRSAQPSPPARSQPAESAQATKEAGNSPMPANSPEGATPEASASPAPPLGERDPNNPPASAQGLPGTVAQGQNLEWEQAGSAPSLSGKPGPSRGVAEAKSQPPVPAARKTMAAQTPAESTSAGEKHAGDDLVARGERYLYGQGVRRDCNQAMVYFRAGAEHQNPKALSRLGTLYATGTCVPMDRVMAYNWFSRALAHDSNNQLLENNLNMLWRDMDPKERQQVLEPRR